MEGATDEDIAHSTSFLKGLAERRFGRVSEGSAEVKDRGFYEQEDTQIVKGLRRDTEAVTYNFEKALSRFESKYKGKVKKQKELQEVESNWPIIKDTRTCTIQLAKEDFTAMKEFRKKEIFLH